ncbi:uncharacterized protein LOC111262492 isoform X2 [Varroa jacobsoni]|uniref:uncharacterized protein LOC111262492 isoform X2 n=1 Tax=Varroa jacobsoni TaxID=62625 RepID=UPI000BF75152|nr:uncharacterized protein LOC111262492 isoform X2 [Varroa jacobsoni]
MAPDELSDLSAIKKQLGDKSRLGPFAIFFQVFRYRKNCKAHPRTDRYNTNEKPFATVNDCIKPMSSRYLKVISELKMSWLGNLGLRTHIQCFDLGP